MKKLLLATALCAISFGPQANAFGGGPFDYKILLENIEQAKRLKEQVAKAEQQIQQGAQQLEQLKSQLDQAKQLYNSLNVKPDISGLKEMFNKQGSSGALPSDFNHFQQSMGSGGGGGGGGSKNTQKWQE
ncbi:type IV secretion system protein, partial [Bartonella sp. AA1HLJMS]|uniref:type IV secretion system protein n=1 Tax=Bartonella sp. AA1HLJMS TaxID=3243424 RepID=UPI0035CEB571